MHHILEVEQYLLEGQAVSAGGASSICWRGKRCILEVERYLLEGQAVSAGGASGVRWRGKQCPLEGQAVSN